jgi:hypothetical protein
LNVGVILFCRTLRYLEARVELDRARVTAFSPCIDLPAVRTHLSLIPRICAGEGPIGQLDQADRFHWITAPHSTVIQTSEVHCGTCTDPAAELEHLMDVLVRVRMESTTGRPAESKPMDVSS